MPQVLMPFIHSSVKSLPWCAARRPHSPNRQGQHYSVRPRGFAGRAGWALGALLRV